MYKDDSQNHELLHASCVHTCQGMGDGNLHIHFNIYFKMAVTLCISLQLLVIQRREHLGRRK